MQPKDDFNAKQLLRRIKEYKEADPNWDKAIERLVEAEARYGKDDPAEGKVVIKRIQAPKRSK